MKRILVDVRFAGIGESISRYGLEVLEGILKLDQKNEYTLLVRKEGLAEVFRYFSKDKYVADEFSILNSQFPINFQIPNSKYQNLKVVIFDIAHYSKSEQTKLLNYLNKEKFDLVHFTQFNYPILYRGKFVVTVHDLTMQGHLHRQKFHRRFACNMVMKSAVKKSKKIITVSNFSKQDIIDWYKVPEDKIVVTYNGLDHDRYNSQISNQQSAITSFKEKYKIAGEYLLYTGAWKRHKNILRMLKAFEIYVSSQQSAVSSQKITANSKSQIANLPQLVLVGKIDTKEPEVLDEIKRINKSLYSQFKIHDSILTTGFVEEGELPIAYAGAKAYIIPSLNEGFGLPPLEAMACGVPVISSKESCMPEILGDAAYYFDPYNVKNMADAIEKINSAKALREELIKKGLTQAKKYNWSDTARKTFDVYKEVLKQS